MEQRFKDISSYPPKVGKLREEQKLQKGEWAQTADWQNTQMAAIHKVNQRRIGKTTVTEVNPLDPGDGGWYDAPTSVAPTVGARRLR